MMACERHTARTIRLRLPPDAKLKRALGLYTVLRAPFGMQAPHLNLRPSPLSEATPAAKDAAVERQSLLVRSLREATTCFF